MSVSARWGVLAAFGLWAAAPQNVNAAEPCKLLSSQEIGQVLGDSVSAPKALGNSGCIWAGSSKHVTILVRPLAAWARITTPDPGITKTSVSGLGEAASFSGTDKSNAGADKSNPGADKSNPGADKSGSGAENPNLLTLSVKQGSNVFVVTVFGVTDAERERSEEESLARLALPRL
jgi:hypothetical protein